MRGMTVRWMREMWSRPPETWSRQCVISSGWPWWAAAAASEQSIGVAVIKVRNERAQRHGVLDDALANDIQRASALGGRTGRAKATGRIEKAKFGPRFGPVNA